MPNKNLYIDKHNRLVHDGPLWESEEKMKPKLADNIWRTALGCFAYPNERKQLMDGLNTCYQNGKYWRHPDWKTDNFSRDQYIMLIAAQYMFGDIKKFPPKLKLSKRYFNSLNIIAWWNYLRSGKRFYAWLFQLTLIVNIHMYKIRWKLYDLGIKKLMPEFYGFHLMCWQYYIYSQKETKFPGITFLTLANYLNECETRVDKNCNVLLWNLLGQFYGYDEYNLQRVSGFPWQNLVPWQDIKIKSHHEYSKGYWEKVPNRAKCLFVDVLKYFSS